MNVEEIFQTVCQFTVWQELGVRVSNKNLTIQQAETPNSFILIAGFPCQSLHTKIKNIWADHFPDLLLDIQSIVRTHRPGVDLPVHPNIKNIIAVASGKGGVGKSTVAINLALALQAEGASVGLLDADIYGPSLPILLGTNTLPDSPDGNTLQPISCYGLQAMSIGFLLQEQDTAMIWRGPMVSTALQQLYRDCQWQNLDYLIIDLPPGTGDIQLTLVQKIPLTAAIIVTTPQNIATADAQKAFRMFEKVKIPVLGIIENMSIYHCTNCGQEAHLFGEGGGAQIAEKYGLNLLGQLPLDITIRTDCDQGKPSLVTHPDSSISMNFKNIAVRMTALLAERAVYKPSKIPKIVVE